MHASHKLSMSALQLEDEANYARSAKTCDGLLLTVITVKQAWLYLSNVAMQLQPWP